ncbi:MAG: GtrA family protein [Bacteroidetes bacterium]|jgi:putative flippase GtrA|nr:GtrA family protein [Bacteroidota bacterium]
MIQTFIKYGIVGFSGFCIDFSVTIFLKEKLHIHRYISNSCGFTVAASTNWFLNRIWTFASDNPRLLLEYGSFFAISLIGLGINNGFLYLFEKRMNFYPAKVFAIGVTVVWNFFANYYITFGMA